LNLAKNQKGRLKKAKNNMAKKKASVSLKKLSGKNSGLKIVSKLARISTKNVAGSFGKPVKIKVSRIRLPKKHKLSK